MSKIYRYELDVADYREIDLPLDAELLSVAVSRSQPNTKIDAWVQVDDTNARERVAIYMVGTGNPMPESLFASYWKQFLGTVVTPSGRVWHVFASEPIGGPR